MVRVFYGIFFGLYYVLVMVFISEVYWERKGFVMGIFMVGLLVGSGIVFLIVVFIVFFF